MKIIPLSKGFFALVDDEDYDRLSEYKWYPLLRKRKTGCALYAISYEGPNSFSMHRKIMGFPDLEVDHKNRNGLDNRRRNLRLANSSQNKINSPKRTGCKMSRFKGVWRDYRFNGAWQARIRINGKKMRLGSFETEEEAAQAYLKKAKELYGEFVPS